MFVPLATYASMFTYTHEITRRFRFGWPDLNLAPAPGRLNDRHSSQIVCSSAPAFSSCQGLEDGPQPGPRNRHWRINKNPADLMIQRGA